LITEFILIKSGEKINLFPFRDKANLGIYVLERVWKGCYYNSM
jgi:hypothetical protein